MRILILTDIPPCTNYTAGLVINSWCDFLLEDNHEISCALIKDASLNPQIPKDKLSRIKFLELKKPREYWGLGERGRFNAFKEFFFSLIKNSIIKMFEIPKIASEVSKFVIMNDCELILVLIQGQTMIYLARRVFNSTQIEYIAQTWDPLDWWLKDHKFDPITSFLNLREFGKVIKGSKSFMAMSWAMSNYFEHKYKVKSITNLPSLRENKQNKSIKKSNNTFVISFSGQLYAEKEFDILVEALKRMHWKHCGRIIELNLYGTYFNEKYHNISGINVFGFIAQEKLLSILSNSDLLYCPYWFSKEYRLACKISFPAKLTSYLKTGKPILMHAPEYASPRIFLEKNKASYICNTLDIVDMEHLIKKIIEDKSGRNILGLRGKKLFEKYLTHKSMKKSLMVSLGLMDEKEIKEFESVREIYPL